MYGIQPTCHVNHLPPFVAKYDEFKAKGVDVIAVVAANDPFGKVSITYSSIVK